MAEMIDISPPGTTISAGRAHFITHDRTMRGAASSDIHALRFIPVAVYSGIGDMTGNEGRRETIKPQIQMISLTV
jgi:hypothetical protein